MRIRITDLKWNTYKKGKKRNPKYELPQNFLMTMENAPKPFDEITMSEVKTLTSAWLKKMEKRFGYPIIDYGLSIDVSFNHPFDKEMVNIRPLGKFHSKSVKSVPVEC